MHCGKRHRKLPILRASTEAIGQHYDARSTGIKKGIKSYTFLHRISENMTNSQLRAYSGISRNVENLSLYQDSYYHNYYHHYNYHHYNYSKIVQRLIQEIYMTSIKEMVGLLENLNFKCI